MWTSWWRLSTTQATSLPRTGRQCQMNFRACSTALVFRTCTNAISLSNIAQERLKDNSPLKIPGLASERRCQSWYFQRRVVLQAFLRKWTKIPDDYEELGQRAL